MAVAGDSESGGGEDLPMPTQGLRMMRDERSLSVSSLSSTALQKRSNKANENAPSPVWHRSTLIPQLGRQISQPDSGTDLDRDPITLHLDISKCLQVYHQGAVCTS